MEAVFPFWAPRANQNARPSTLGQCFLLIVTNSERVPNYEHVIARRASPVPKT